jgi:DUF1365 family protein
MGSCKFNPLVKYWTAFSANPKFSFLLEEISTTNQQRHTNTDTKIDAKAQSAGRRRIRAVISSSNTKNKTLTKPFDLLFK